MTLLLGMVNPAHAVVISDRRLTINGQLFDDESSKLFTLTCRDARLAFAFTGLAKAKGFETRSWLLRTLLDAAARDARMRSMLADLRATLTSTFVALKAADKRLSVMCVGFRYDERVNEVMAMISNYDGFGRAPDSVAASEFRLEYSADSPSAVAGNVLGASISADDVESLKDLARSEHVPASALVGKGVAAIRAAAERPSARGYIGKQCFSVILPADRSQPAIPEYHSETVKTVLPGIAHIEARRGAEGSIVIDTERLEIYSDETPIPLAGPPSRPTAPCWCGSGKQFRHCHGRG